MTIFGWLHKMTTLLLGVHRNSSGRRYYAESYYFANSDLTKDEILELVINKTRFDYVAGRKVYRKNERAERLIAEGNLEWEFDNVSK